MSVVLPGDPDDEVHRRTGRVCGLQVDDPLALLRARGRREQEAGRGEGGDSHGDHERMEFHRTRTSKLGTGGVPVRPAVTSTAYVQDGGSVAPVTGTWSAVTGVAGNLRPGPSEWRP
jgi:hypothetical protein